MVFSVLSAEGHLGRLHARHGRGGDASGPTESHRRQYSKQEACQTAAGKRNGAFCNGMTPN